MKRDNSISLIRFIAMLMIIGCHFLQSIDNHWAFWMNVGVQIFLFISGYLYGAKKLENVRQFYVKRIKTILLPYLVLAIIMCIVEWCVLGNKYGANVIIGSFLGFGGVNSNFVTLPHTWFVTYILICYFITPLLSKIFRARKFKTNAWRLVTLLCFVQALQTFSVMNLNACWINTFILGYFYTKCCRSAIQQKRAKICLASIFALVMPFAVMVQENLLVLPSFATKYSNMIIDYGHVLLGIMLFFVLHDLFSKIQVRESWLLRMSDKYSYYIYLVHQIYILGPFSLMGLTNIMIINILLILVLIIVSAVALAKICELINLAFKRFAK